MPCNISSRLVNSRRSWTRRADGWLFFKKKKLITSVQPSQGHDMMIGSALVRKYVLVVSPCTRVIGHVKWWSPHPHCNQRDQALAISTGNYGWRYCVLAFSPFHVASTTKLAKYCFRNRIYSLEAQNCHRSQKRVYTASDNSDVPP